MVPSFAAAAPTPRTVPLTIDLSRRFAVERGHAIRLHPRLLPQGKRLEPTASKVGGSFAWPVNDSWPKCDEHDVPLLFVMQLRREEFPQFPFRGDENLVQIFFCLRYHDEGEDATFGIGVKLFWWNTNKLNENDVQENAMDDELEGEFDFEVKKPPESEFHPEKVEEFFTRDIELMREIDEWVTTSEEGKRELDALGIAEDMRDGPFQYLMSTAPGIKLLGFPTEFEYDPIKCKRCKQEMSHLAQIAMDCGLGEMHARWGAKGDELSLVGGLDDEVHVFIFVCKTCEERQLRAICIEL